MLREPNLTDGIGARTAHNIPCTSTEDVLIDRILTSVTSAKQKKTTKTAQPKEPVRIVKKSQQRRQLEALREIQSEKQEEALLRNHCGKATRKGKEIIIRGSLGEVKRSYHKSCFKAVLSS